MKKIIGLAIGTVAVLALSGCNNVGTSPQANVKITETSYTAINSSKSEVFVDNQSNYDIVEIWSGKVGGSYTLVKPPKNVAAGSDRTFGTINCSPNTTEEWKIKVIDDTYNYATLVYNRQCGYRENLLVTDN
jgi:hypothetical protein